MNKNLLAIISSLILFIAGLLLEQYQYIQLIIYIIAYLLVGYPILKKGLQKILKGKVFTESFLMSIATIGAFAIEAYPEAVAVMLFYQVGEYLQDLAVDSSKKSIKALMELRPDYGNLLLENGKTKVVHPEEIKVGDRISIKPGEKIPLDALIIKGETTANTSNITGEAKPKKLVVGDEILSGYVNITGMVEAKVIRPFKESTVNQILDMVEAASHLKSKNEQFITRFAEVYTPVVVIIGLAVAFLPPLFGLGDLSTWIYRGLAFLVISCPCALVVSVPLSFFAGIGSASKKGILVKGSNYLEALAQVKTVAFDKTGTLTKGVFQVVKIVGNKGIDEREVLAYAAILEEHSSHPIAESIKTRYGQRSMKEIVDFKEYPGFGLKGYLEGVKIVVGSKSFLKKEGYETIEVHDTGSVVHVGSGIRYLGYIIVSDELKETTTKAMAELREAGVTDLRILSGDSRRAVGEVAAQLGIDCYCGDLLPGDKLALLEKIFSEKTPGQIAFVGDGINDMPVLARADVGISMGGIGRDGAIEAGDIVIMDDDLRKIALGIKIAKKTLWLAKENVVLAIAIKVLVMILSTLGLVGLWLAVFADVGVTVLAVLNALRGMWIKE